MSTAGLVGSRTHEARYRVHEFRRTLTGSDRPRRGLVQFWGQRARRTIDHVERDDGGYDKIVTDWDIEADDHKLHTVEIADVVTVTDQRRK